MSVCAKVHVSLGRAGDPLRVADLEAQLGSLPPGFAEIRVDLDPFPALSGLVNGDLGWLMYVRYDGDAGFSSRNPSYRGDPDATISYRLSNGQLDAYPAAWSYPRPVVLDAVRHFARHGRVPGDIVWFNDSRDGAVSPDD